MIDNICRFCMLFNDRSVLVFLFRILFLWNFYTTKEQSPLTHTHIHTTPHTEYPLVFFPHLIPSVFLKITAVLNFVISCFLYIFTTSYLVLPFDFIWMELHRRHTSLTLRLAFWCNFSSSFLISSSIFILWIYAAYLFILL